MTNHIQQLKDEVIHPNLVDCKECKHFNSTNNKPQCLMMDTDPLSDCQQLIDVIDIS